MSFAYVSRTSGSEQQDHGSYYPIYGILFLAYSLNVSVWSESGIRPLVTPLYSHKGES